MSTHVLTITYQQPAAPVDPYWVRIQQEDLADQTATVADAAALLDALYRIEPCADGQSTPELVSDLAEAVAETEILAYCGQEPDGSVEVELDVIRSHLAEPYRLRLQGGEVVKTVEVAERVTVRMEIGATVTLDYPVVSGFACDPEPLARAGNTLSFAADHVGRGLTATYLSRWDRVTVKVLGVNGKAGSCRALAFHHGLVADVELQVPDADEVDRLLCPATRWEIDWGNQEVICYQDVTVIRQCNCSETEVDRYTYQQVVPCPNPEMRCPGAESRCMHLVGSKAVTEWVECQGDNAIPGRPGATYAVSSPEYYRRMCCQDPPGSLPQCEVKHATYQGELDIQPGRQYWRDLYGDHARFVPVPPPGGICGEWTIEQRVLSNNCCDGVEPLVWDVSISPEVISPNSAVIVGVIGGGRYPYRWSVAGHGFQWHNGETEVETAKPYARLSALPLACGTARITVTDDCSVVVVDIRCTAGKWAVVAASFYPDSLADPPADMLYPCAAYGPPYTPAEPPVTSILQGRWYVGRDEDVPPAISTWTYYRESHIYGLWASESLHGPIMVPAPGTNGEVKIPALIAPHVGNCVPLAGSGNPGDGVWLYWYAPRVTVYEWVCP